VRIFFDEHFTPIEREGKTLTGSTKYRLDRTIKMINSLVMR